LSKSWPLSFTRSSKPSSTAHPAGCDNAAFPAGIVAQRENRIEHNQVTGNDWGIRLTSTNNFVVGNTALGNTTNYDFGVNNRCGEIINAGLVISNSAGAWANFAF